MSHNTNRSGHRGASTRREFLARSGALALAAAGGLAATRPAAASETAKSPWKEAPRGPYAPFHMALQTYSLRKLDFQQAIDAAYDLELKLVELWPGHFPQDLSEAELRGRFKAMRYNVLKRIGYGVVELTKDAVATRDIFEFAKKLNVHALTALPAPDSFDGLEEMVEKSGIAVAIHNHGPEDKLYGTPERIAKAIEGRHELIGLCVDTGHFLRVGVDPVDVVKTFKGRIHAVHLKDVKTEGGTTRDVVLGDGRLDLVAFLRALKEAGFRGGLALEYEAEPESPMPGIQKCLAAVRGALKEIG